MDLEEYGKYYHAYAMNCMNGKIILGMSKRWFEETEEMAMQSYNRTGNEILTENPVLGVFKEKSTGTGNKREAQQPFREFALEIVELYGVERIVNLPKNLEKPAEAVATNSKKREVLRLDEVQQDQIFKFYYDFLLVRIFGWDVSYRPHRLVLPLKPQLLALSLCINIPVVDIENYMKDGMGQKEFMKYVRKRFNDTYWHSFLYDAMRYPDQIKFYVERNHEPFEKVEDASGEFRQSVKNHALIELHVQYILAEVFSIDTDSGAPYQVMNHFSFALEELCKAVGITTEQWERTFSLEAAQEQFLRRFEQQLRSLHGKVIAELYMNPNETLALYALDF